MIFNYFFIASNIVAAHKLCNRSRVHQCTIHISYTHHFHYLVLADQVSILMNELELQTLLYSIMNS